MGVIYPSETNPAFVAFRVVLAVFFESRMHISCVSNQELVPSEQIHFYSNPTMPAVFGSSTWALEVRIRIPPKDPGLRIFGFMGWVYTGGIIITQFLQPRETHAP